MTGVPLYLFAKAPVAGHVKRRMCPPLDEVQSARVALAMLNHTTAAVERGWFGQRVLNVTPDLSHSAFESYQGSIKWQSRVQIQADLGERMREVLQEGIEAYGAAAVLGTDIPAIDVGVLREVFRALQAGEQVVGPSLDGGFYLLGLREMPADLFKGIEWGTDGVYAKLMENAGLLDIKLESLPTLSDCDHIEELKRAAQTIPSFRGALREARFDMKLI